MSTERNRPMPDDELGRAARALFDDSVDELDGATLSRLNQGRHRALEKATPSPAYLRPLPWLATSGAAAAVVVAVLISGQPASTPDGVGPGTAADVEILLQGDDFEMLEELEFYSWIELGPETAANVG